MQNYINDFLKTLAADGKSKCTVNNYGLDLKQFANDMTKPVEQIKFADLRSWVNTLAERGLAPTSRARKISAVRSFFKYLRKMEIIEKNPAEDLETPKLEKKQPKVITADAASKMLFHARNDGDRPATYMRDLAVIMVFLYTGVRREELTNIKLSDVSLTNGTILIHGKGNKQRTVFCNPQLIAVLSEYINAHRGLLSYSKNSEYLFISQCSEKLCVRSVNDIVDKYMERAGCKEKGMSCHQLRKRMATSAFYATHDLISVQRILGHSSPTTTQRYISDDIAAMQNAAMAISF